MPDRRSQSGCLSPKQRRPKMAAFFTFVMHLGTISCRAPRREPSLPRQRALWRELRGLSLCERDVQPSRDFLLRDASRLRHDASRRAHGARKPSCDVQLPSWTWIFPFNLPVGIHRAAEYADERERPIIRRFVCSGASVKALTVVGSTVSIDGARYATDAAEAARNGGSLMAVLQSIEARDGAVMRRHAIRKIQHHLVNIRSPRPCSAHSIAHRNPNLISRLVMANLRAAHTAEKSLGPIRASAIHRIRFLVIDPAHLCVPKTSSALLR